MVAPVVLGIRWGYQIRDNPGTKINDGIDDELYVLFDRLLDSDNSSRSSDWALTINGSRRSFEEEPVLGDGEPYAWPFRTHSGEFNRAFGVELSVSAWEGRCVELHIAGDPVSSEPTGAGINQLAYRAPGQRFGLRNEAGTDYVASFSHPIPYTRPAPQPTPTPSSGTAIILPKRYRREMNLRNFDRDLTLIANTGTQGFASTEKDFAVTDQAILTNGLIPVDGINAVNIRGATLSVSNGKCKGSGVLMQSPRGPRECYRVKAFVSSESGDVRFGLVCGSAPAANLDAAGGAVLTNTVYLTTFENSLFVDDVFAVAPFAGAVANRPIIFGVVALNSTGSDISNDKGVGILSVQSMHHVPRYDSYTR